MSEFPELQGYEVPTSEVDEISESDLASRERELLGEDAAEFVGSSSDAATAQPPSDGEEVDDGTALPSTATSPSHTGSAAVSQSETKAPGAGPSAYVPQKVDPSQSEFLKDWKIKRDLEIERRDKVSNDKREGTREKARKAIDDFYENYNAKKEKEIQVVRDDAEQFAKKRDAEIGSGKGTAWDRIADLMDGLGRPGDGVVPKDKKRFSELVQSLKGDVNAPGAGGY